MLSPPTDTPTATPTETPADTPTDRSTPRSATTTELARSLGIAVLRFSRSLRGRSGVELSPSLISALLSVRRHGPLTPSDLADHERVRRPTATRFIACLESGGLVDRTADPEDGRSYRVAVTARGTELLRSARRQQDAYLAGRLATLDPEDLATLERAAAILDRLTFDETRSDQSASEDAR